MKTTTTSTGDKPKTHRQHLKKIPSVPCLYRHDITGFYYGIKKHGGKIKQTPFDVNDRQLAEAKLKDWIDLLEGSTGGKITIHALAEKWFALNSKQNPRSIENYRLVKDRLIKFFKSNPQVTDIKHSEVLDYIAELKAHFSAATSNAFTQRTKLIFQLGVDDRHLVKNPFDAISKKTTYRKIIRKQPPIPTLEQFEKIVNHIRTQRFSDTRDEASDLCEFMGLSGLGTAECFNLRYEHINLAEKKISTERVKTDKPFNADIPPWLETWLIPFLVKRHNRKTGQVFKVRCIKESLKNACRKLKYPKFTPRNLRQMAIVRLLRAGYPPKLVALGQGHKDESLILKVYSSVISGDDETYRKEMLAKLSQPKQEESVII